MHENNLGRIHISEYEFHDKNKPAFIPNDIIPVHFSA